MIKQNTNLSKCCGIAYDYIDIERIVQFCNKHNFRYYVMKHLADVEDEEKEHYHFIIESDRQHRFVISSLLTDTFKANLFEKCENVGSYLRYMTHCDYALKHKYDVAEFISNVPDFVIQVLIDEANMNLTKQERRQNDFYAVIEAISSENLFSLVDIISWCRNNNIAFDTKWTYTLKIYLYDLVHRSNKYALEQSVVNINLN